MYISTEVEVEVEIDVDTVVDWVEQCDCTKDLLFVRQAIDNNMVTDDLSSTLELLGVEDFLNSYIAHLYKINNPNAFLCELRVKEFLNGPR